MFSTAVNLSCEVSNNLREALFKLEAQYPGYHYHFLRMGEVGSLRYVVQNRPLSVLERFGVPGGVLVELSPLACGAVLEEALQESGVKAVIGTVGNPDVDESIERVEGVWEWLASHLGGDGSHGAAPLPEPSAGPVARRFFYQAVSPYPSEDYLHADISGLPPGKVFCSGGWWVLLPGGIPEGAVSRSTHPHQLKTLILELD